MENISIIPKVLQDSNAIEMSLSHTEVIIRGLGSMKDVWHSGKDSFVATPGSTTSLTSMNLSFFTVKNGDNSIYLIRELQGLELMYMEDLVRVLSYC